VENAEKLHLTEQEHKQTGKKPQFTEQKLQRTVKNVKLPIENSNQR